MAEQLVDGAPPRHSGPPDWNTLPEEITCPLCEYNLRGLTEPRCPECGYAFQWPDLLDPARREHPYLFELRPTHNFTSFWKTAFHGLRPSKFWTALRADQRSKPSRLMTYWLIIAAIVLLAFAGDYFVEMLDAHMNYNWMILSIRGVPLRGAIWPPSTIVPPAPWPMLPLNYFVIPAVATLSWPWLTFVSLSIFQISMRRASVKQVHVLRCVVYSWDAFLWIALISLLVESCRAVGIMLSHGAARSPLTSIFETGTPNWIWCILVGLCFIYRLIVAYWRYLRFRHVIATVLASQLIVLLAMAVALVLLQIAEVI